MSNQYPPFATCTCFSLRRLTRTVTRLYDQHLAEVGLKITQYSILKFAQHGALPIAEMAMHLSTERTTLTRNLKPLIEAGWIRLEQGKDSRQRIVTITAAGQNIIKKADQAWRSAQTQLEHTLGLPMVEELHADLETALKKVSPLLLEETLFG